MLYPPSPSYPAPPLPVYRPATKEDVGKRFLIRHPDTGRVHQTRILHFSPLGTCVEVGGNDLDSTLHGWFFPLHLELVEELPDAK